MFSKNQLEKLASWQLVVLMVLSFVAAGSAVYCIAAIALGWWSTLWAGLGVGVVFGGTTITLGRTWTKRSQ